MKFKEYRNMKVYDQSSYGYKRTPMIILKGQWLEELGFERGTPITVHCEDGILTITRADILDYDDVPEEIPMNDKVAESGAKYNVS